MEASPLIDLMKDGIRWQWIETEKQAFRQLERSLITAPVLKMPDFERAFVVTTEASLVPVGAILEQYFG